MATFSIRLALQDADTVKRALQGLGADGEAALKRLEKAAASAAQGGGARSFKLLESSGSNLGGTFRKLAEASSALPGPLQEVVAQVGLFGRVMNPVGLAATALAAGIALLAGNQVAAERATALHTAALKDYKAALDGAKDSGGQLSQQERERLEVSLRLAQAATEQALAVEEANLRAAVAQRAVLAQFSQGVGESFSQGEQALLALTQAFAKGELSIADFRAELNELALADPGLVAAAVEVGELSQQHSDLTGKLAETTAALADLKDGTLDAGAAFDEALKRAGDFGRALAGLREELGASAAALAERQAAFASGGVAALSAVTAQQKAEAEATAAAARAVESYNGPLRRKAELYGEIYAEALTLAQGEAALAAASSAATTAHRAGAQAGAELERSWAALLNRLDPLAAAQQRFAEEQALLNRAQAEGRISDEAAALAKARLTEAYADQLDPLGALQKSLREEARLAALSARERERHNRILDAENKLRAAGLAVTEQMRKAIEAEVDAVLRANEAMVARGEAEKEATAARERFATEVARVSEDIADDLTTALFEGAENGFDDILGSLDKWIERIGLELLKQNIILPITTELVGATSEAFGIEGGGGGGNGQTLFGAVGALADDAIGWLGRQLGFGSQTRAAVGNDGRLTGGNAATGGYVDGSEYGGGVNFGSLIAGTVQGATLGTAVNELLGVNGNQSQYQQRNSNYGALAGAAIGTAIAAYYTGGNAWAMQAAGAAGGQLGSMVGSLFGPGPSAGPWGLGTAHTSAGRLAYVGGTSLKGGVGDMSGLVNETTAVANTLADLFGAEFADNALLRIGYVNNEKGEKGYVVSGSGPKGTNVAFKNWKEFGDDKQAAQIFAVKHAIMGGGFNGISTGDGLEGLSDDERKYLGTSLTIRKSIDEVMADAALIADLYGEQTDTLSEAALAIREVNDAYDQQIDRAKALGIAETELEARRAEALAELKSGFMEGIEDQILAITDPLAFAIKQLDREFETIRQNAEDFGLGLVEVERLYGLKRQQIIEQIAQTTVSDLRRFLEELQFGELSGGAPGARLEDARAAFDAASAAALDGDGAARGRVQDLGSTLLELSRGYNASGAGYFEDLDRVRGIVEALLGEMPGYASGVLGAPGGWSLVGERGPEAMFVPRGASILPAAFTRMMQGGGQGGWPSGGDGPLREIARLQAENVQVLRQKLGLDEELRGELRQLGSGLRRLLSLLPTRTV